MCSDTGSITWILNVLVLDRHLQMCLMSMSSGSEEETGRNSAVRVSRARLPSLLANKPSEPTSPVVRPFPTRRGGWINRRALAVPMRAVLVTVQLHRD